MADESFDAIVVGAGPAGCACAYSLARFGRNVLLLERGDAPGAKNVSGGRLYTYALDLVDPGLRARAPLQRKIIREQVMLLDARRALTVDFHDPAFGDEAPNAYSVVRASLDAWFAGEAEAAGAMVASGVKVDGLLEEGGRIVGIRAGEDEMRADVVIAADGVNAVLGRQAGLFPDVQARAVGLGLKETLELPDDVIDARFGVGPEEGAARVAVGCTAGMAGGAFLYTNRGSLSLGLVVNPEQAGRSGRPVQELLQDLKTHPAIAPLVAGATPVEFGAHLVPELGHDGVPERLHREGLLVVGDAAQFGINTGLIIRGMDLAIVSGLAAAQAVIASPKASQCGEAYMRRLEELSLLPSLEAYRRFHRLFEIGRIFREYPAMAGDIMQFLFKVDGTVPPPMVRRIRQLVKARVPFGQLARDAWKGFRSL
ncbi:FAD-dependent oxidoreductase [Mesoterricola sediminis]|uniref:Oxidoreductase FixC n=1 Tax=Mesoterricola sediminis TaxID=2927980 RepID=A0AA48KDM6_9BACT|nr:FAD-dependent oxidoreductase [Mesoterricola sediminis]BDU78366.1 oxidoreductase FixC [Mesoterricola sediminis]